MTVLAEDRRKSNMQMRPITFVTGIAVLTAVLAFGCGGQSSSDTQSSHGPSALQVSLRFSPDPMRIGSEKATVTVTDSAGKPVAGADVVIFSGMPAMKMNVPMRMPAMGTAGKTYHAKDLGGGTYRADVGVTMSTLWDFVVHASTQSGGYGTALYEAQISGNRR